MSVKATMFVESVARKEYGTDGSWVMSGKGPFKSFSISINGDQVSEMAALVGKQVQITIEACPDWSKEDPA